MNNSNAMTLATQPLSPQQEICLASGQSAVFLNYTSQDRDRPESECEIQVGQQTRRLPQKQLFLNTEKGPMRRWRLNSAEIEWYPQDDALIYQGPIVAVSPNGIWYHRQRFYRNDTLPTDWDPVSGWERLENWLWRLNPEIAPPSDLERRLQAAFKHRNPDAPRSESPPEKKQTQKAHAEKAQSKRAPKNLPPHSQEPKGILPKAGRTDASKAEAPKSKDTDSDSPSAELLQASLSELAEIQSQLQSSPAGSASSEAIKPDASKPDAPALYQPSHLSSASRPKPVPIESSHSEYQAQQLTESPFKQLVVDHSDSRYKKAAAQSPHKLENTSEEQSEAKASHPLRTLFFLILGFILVRGCMAALF